LDAVADRINELFSEEVIEPFYALGVPKDIGTGEPCAERDAPQRSC
jgi:hypothetical protein